MVGGEEREREGQQKKQLVLFSFPSAEFQKKKKKSAPEIFITGFLVCTAVCTCLCVCLVSRMRFNEGDTGN